MPRHTLRGNFTEDTTRRLIVADGNLNMGHRIVRFVISGNPNTSTNDAYALLCTSADSPNKWDWADNRQIGWASTVAVSTGGLSQGFEVIDPEHIVLQDLFIKGKVGSSGGTSEINYLIELEPVKLSDEETVMQLIKERSQDDV